MIEIVLCTDDNYVMPTAVLMTSIAASNPEEQVHYNIISAGLSQKSKDALSRHLVNPSFGISFYTIDESYLKDCPIRRGEHVSIATYFRLLLPTILPKEIDKVLYMDGDIICLDSIKELWETPLENFSAAAAPDMRCNDIRVLNRLSFKRTDDYFNAGVMLINLDWWRKNDIQNKSIKFISENRNICQFHDQDALNVVLHGTIQTLSIRFNLQEHFFEPFENQFIDRAYLKDMEEAKVNAALIHYTGFKKPWHRECVNPLKSIWRHFYKKTEWKNKKLAYRYTGFRHIKYEIRTLFDNFGLIKSRNLYKGLDLSHIEQELFKKIHG